MWHDRVAYLIGFNSFSLLCIDCAKLKQKKAGEQNERIATFNNNFCI